MTRVVQFLIFNTLTLFSFVALAEGDRLTMSQFLSSVRTTSPEFVIEKANIEVAQARSNGIRVNPPMIGYMQMRGEDGTTHGFEIAQDIPFPTKLYQDKKVRELELEAQKDRSKLQETFLLADARAAYVNFWGTYARLEIQKEKLDWLKHHVKIARTSSWSDTDAKVHLLEIETDADLIENEILSLDAELIEKRNALRIYAPDLKIENVLPEEPSALEIKVEKNSANSLVTLREKELSATEALVSSKKQAYVPDLYVRYRSYDKNENIPRSQELMVGITIPFLYFWQPRAEVAEASAQRMKAQAELQKSKIEFEGKFLSLSKKAENTRAQIKNLKQKLIPRAERRTKLVRNISTRTMEGLDQHKQVMLGFLELKLKSVELQLNYENTIKDIVKLTGASAEVGSPK